MFVPPLHHCRPLIIASKNCQVVIPSTRTASMMFPLDGIPPPSLSASPHWSPLHPELHPHLDWSILCSCCNSWRKLAFHRSLSKLAFLWEQCNGNYNFFRLSQLFPSFYLHGQSLRDKSRYFYLIFWKEIVELFLIQKKSLPLFMYPSYLEIQQNPRVSPNPFMRTFSHSHPIKEKTAGGCQVWDTIVNLIPDMLTYLYEFLACLYWRIGIFMSIVQDCY